MVARTAQTVPEATGPDVVEYDSGMNARRPRGKLVAVTLLLACVALAVLTFLLLGGDTPTARQEPSRSGAPAAAAPTTAPAPSTPAATEQAPLTSAPEGVTWELFQGIALPVSATDGPTRVDGPVHAGFSRTPTGALLASAQISYRQIATPGTAWRRVVEEQIVPGPGRTAFLNLAAGVSNDGPPAAGYAQIVGFRFITYTPDLAVVSLASRGKSGRTQVGTETLRWRDGDWKLELPASGLQQPQVVQGLAGYVPWQGVS